MIIVNEGWAITCDGSNYMPAKVVKSKKEDGETRYDVKAYYVTLAGAVSYIADAMMKEYISKEDVDLRTAIAEMRFIYGDLRRVLEENIPREVR